MAHSSLSSPPWAVRPSALPDRDPDAPDDDPSAPLSVLARWFLSVSTSVNYRRNQALELWHTIVNLVVLLFTAILDKMGAICSGIHYFYVWFQVEPTSFRVLILTLTWNYMFGAYLLQRLRAVPLGCDDRQIVIVENPSTVGHSRLSWNFQVYLKQALKTTKMIIISWITWITVKATSRFDEVVWIYNVSKTFIQRFLYNTLKKYKNQDLTIQQTSVLCVMNPELRDTIFAKLPFNEIFRLRTVCKAFDSVMESETFKSLCKTSEGLFGPNVFYLEITTLHMTWQWISYDIISQQWKIMPPFSSLPLPDVELFKDFFVAGGHGLICVDVGKGDIEVLIVYQPLTKQKKVLPYLIHRRRPVLIHVIVDEIANTYKIIVAGSSTIGTKHLSRKTEVYNSCTSCWSESDDIPGPEFALNEYQTGVYVKSLDTLFCIGFLPRDKGRGILAYNVAKKMWIKDAFYQLPDNFIFNEMRVSTQITIAQLIEYDNEVFLFSEQEAGQEVIHSIHKLQRFEEIGIVNDHGKDFGKVTTIWERVLCESRNGTRGLLVYPEFECLVHGKNQFCVFNTVEHCGTLYTIHCKNGKRTTSKQKLPQFPKLKENSLIFHSLNSLGFAFELSFKISL